MQRNKKILSPSELIPNIKSIVDEGGVFPLVVTGVSMRPFLTPEKDTVFIEKTSPNELKKGDVVLIYRSGVPLLHRIYKLHEKGFFLIGDAHAKQDGFFFNEELIGIAKYAVTSSSTKKRKLNTFTLRLLVKINRIRIRLFNKIKNES